MNVAILDVVSEASARHRRPLRQLLQLRQKNSSTPERQQGSFDSEDGILGWKRHSWDLG
jgi:hypothetical protein